MSAPQGLQQSSPGWGRRLTRALVHANWVVAASSALLTYATCQILDLARAAALLPLLAGCATLCVYTLDRVAGFSPEDEINTPERSAWLQKHRVFLVVQMVLAGLVAGVATLGLGRSALLGALGLGALTFSYVLPVLPGRVRLKDLPLAKSILIALVWSLGSVLIPVLHEGQGMTALAWGLLIHHFAWTLGAALYFDLRDLEGDRLHGEWSLAALVGERRGLRLCSLLALAAWAVVLGLVVSGIAEPLLLLVFIADLPMAWLMGSAGSHAESLRYGLAIDGLLGLPGLLVLLLR